MGAQYVREAVAELNGKTFGGKLLKITFVNQL
jgi:hypothetical protein